MHSLAPTHTAAAAPAKDCATPPEAARRVVAQQLLAFSRVLAELAAPSPSTCARRVLCAARNSKCDPSPPPSSLRHPRDAWQVSLIPTDTHSLTRHPANLTLALTQRRLSQMLAPLLAGNGRTFLLATVSAAAADYLDTCNTLRVAARSRTIATANLRSHNTPPPGLALVSTSHVLSFYRAQRHEALLLQSAAEAKDGAAAKPSLYHRVTAPLPHSPSAAPRTTVAAASPAHSPSTTATSSLPSPSATGWVLQKRPAAAAAAAAVRVEPLEQPPPAARVLSDVTNNDAAGVARMMAEAAQWSAAAAKGAAARLPPPAAPSVEAAPALEAPALSSQLAALKAEFRELYHDTVAPLEAAAVSHHLHTQALTEASSASAAAASASAAPCYYHQAATASPVPAERLLTAATTTVRVHADEVTEEVEVERMFVEMVSMEETHERPVTAESAVQAEAAPRQAEEEESATEWVQPPPTTTETETTAPVPAEEEVTASLLRTQLSELREQLVESEHARATVVAMLTAERDGRKRLEARLSETEEDLLEAAAAHEVAMAGAAAEAVSLQGQCRRLQSETSFQEVFAKYERQIQLLTDEASELRAANAALLKKLTVTKGSASSVRPSVGGVGGGGGGGGGGAVDAHAGGGDMVAVEARNQRVAVRRLLTQNEALTVELAELRKKDRQFELHRRRNDDRLRKVNSLATYAPTHLHPHVPLSSSIVRSFTSSL